MAGAVQVARNIKCSESNARSIGLLELLPLLDLFGFAQGRIDRTALMEGEGDCPCLRPSVRARPSFGQDGPGEGEALHGLELLHAARERQWGRRGYAAASTGNGWERGRGVGR